MDIKLATLLAEVCDGEVREDYSGRGMFGKTTAGVICDNPMDILKGVLSDPSYVADVMEDQEIAVHQHLSQFQTDSMGLQTIVY